MTRNDFTCSRNESEAVSIITGLVGAVGDKVFAGTWVHVDSSLEFICRACSLNTYKLEYLSTTSLCFWGSLTVNPYLERIREQPLKWRMAKAAGF
jgi:hypothetical protein